MVINVQCPACGTRLKVGDEAAGKTGKCPDCAGPVQVPEAIYDAEQVAEDVSAEPDFTGAQTEEDEFGLAAPPPRPADTSEPRRPCRSCGEMVLATAAKCRFCGEIFDSSIRSERTARGGSVDPKIVKKFRKEMHALGGFWIFIACLALFGALAMMGNAGRNPDLRAAAIVILVISLLFLGLGFFICIKHMWAVYVGLVFAYISALGNIYQLASGAGGNILSILFLVAIIAQSHRVITTSKQLRNAGIPLTTKV